MIVKEVMTGDISPVAMFATKMDFLRSELFAKFSKILANMDIFSPSPTRNVHSFIFTVMDSLRVYCTTKCVASEHPFSTF